MGKLGMALAVVALLAGCTRVVDDARPLKERPVAPIVASQIEDLLSDTAQGGDVASSLFDSVTPDDCAGLLQEVHAPFVFDAVPVAHTSGYTRDETHEPPGNVVEIVGVYHSDFVAEAAVDGVRRTIEACSRGVVRGNDSDGQRYDYDVRARSDSGSPQIALWSLTLRGAAEWACDDAFIAAYNAAIEITTCTTQHGYDVVTQAQDALKRIERLANAAI